MMNNRLQTLIVAFVCTLFLSACEKVPYQKDVKDYFPSVATKTAIVQPDGSVLVTGNLLSDGSAELYAAGFCLDTLPNPKMNINQVLSGSINDGSFTGIYKNLDAFKTYYVRSFAVNANGFSYGNDLIIQHAGLDTNSLPCHPAANTITGGYTSNRRTETVSSVEELDPVYHDFRVNSNSMTLDFEFGKAPTNGIYQVVENPERNTNQVSIWYRDPTTFGSRVKFGSVVYVSQIAPGRIHVIICDAEVGNEVLLTTNIYTK